MNVLSEKTTVFCLPGSVAVSVSCVSSLRLTVRSIVAGSCSPVISVIDIDENVSSSVPTPGV